MRDFDYDTDGADVVSVLFNEPKLLKSLKSSGCWQRDTGFSALQRAEIAEIQRQPAPRGRLGAVSVLFNEPKLLKFQSRRFRNGVAVKFQCSSTSRNC